MRVYGGIAADPRDYGRKRNIPGCCCAAKKMILPGSLPGTRRRIADRLRRTAAAARSSYATASDENTPVSDQGSALVRRAVGGDPDDLVSAMPASVISAT